MCNKYEIRFSCIANGEVLNFISEEDIYSLFGNILDNAIQAVKCLEKDKRRILLKIKTVGNIVSISCQNPYSQKIELVNGLPKTTKGSITEHGFGLKSIKLIAEKYNGTMNLSYDDNVFSITLMFIKDKKDQSDKK